METENRTSHGVVSTGDWVLTLFLTAIPIVGIIMLFVWGFGSGTNPSKANFAKAALIRLEEEGKIDFKQKIADFLSDVDGQIKNLKTQKEKLEEYKKGMMQKIIKLPVLQLKAACKRGQANTLIDVLNDLFNLEGTNVIPGRFCGQAILSEKRGRAGAF